MPRSPVEISERLTPPDYARVMELLENPPKPNERLRSAAAALPRSK